MSNATVGNTLAVICVYVALILALCWGTGVDYNYRHGEVVAYMRAGFQVMHLVIALVCLRLGKYLE